MTTETKFRGGLAMTLLGLITMTFFYFQQQDELRKCKEEYEFIQGGDIEKSQLTNRADSLYDALFIEKVDAGRHELTRDEILNKYPKVKKEYEEYYNHQTE
jgi:hypothetical protein